MDGRTPTLSGSIFPSILCTCHESQQEGLKVYQRLGFGVWINFSIGTVYVWIAGMPSEIVSFKGSTPHDWAGLLLAAVCGCSAL
jgi:hypothetical protein